MEDGNYIVDDGNHIVEDGNHIVGDGNNIIQEEGLGCFTSFVFMLSCEVSSSQCCSLDAGSLFPCNAVGGSVCDL